MDGIDIKDMTDKLQSGDGCSLKKALGTSTFDEQEGVFEALRAEASARRDSSLSFEKRKVTVEKPDGTPTGDIIPVLDIRKDGSMLFEAFKPPGQDLVYGACRPKTGTAKNMDELESKKQ